MVEGRRLATASFQLISRNDIIRNVVENIFANALVNPKLRFAHSDIAVGGAAAEERFSTIDNSVPDVARAPRSGLLHPANATAWILACVLVVAVLDVMRGI